VALTVISITRFTVKIVPEPRQSGEKFTEAADIFIAAGLVLMRRFGPAELC
jgi:hypothetical protein